MDPSSAVYTKSVVKYLYDFLILGVVNRYAWRCSTGNVLLPFFQENIGKNAHLDVGVGSGYYPSQSVSKFAETKNVTLLDMNPATLAESRARLLAAGYKGTIDTVEQSAYDPLPASLKGKFDSISTFYLLHCMPGIFPEKGNRVFQSLSEGLAPGGVLYGSTVLGKGVPHNFFSRTWMNTWNARDILMNINDTLEGLEEALRESFDEVELRVVGVAALFKARSPKVKKDVSA